MHYFDTATILSILVGTLLPIVVGAVTRVTTHPAIKGAILLALSAASGVLSQWLDAANSHTPFAWQPVVLTAVLTFVTGVTSHTALWKNTPLSNSTSPFGKAPSALPGYQPVTSFGQSASYGAPESSGFTEPKFE